MIATNTILDFFLETRHTTENICKPLEIEDYVVQPIVDVSPPKWHLGHSTWFFEEFILKSFKDNYECFNDSYGFVFNSYYESFGKRVVRTNRGNLSRPTVNDIYKYRHYITKQMELLLQDNDSEELIELVEIGIHHEKQHQELLITDIKYILGNNPLLPKYNNTFTEHTAENHNKEWLSVNEGLYNIGHNSKDFCYDNELGRHQVFINAFQISNTLVTNGEFMDFMEADGYKNALLWHAEAWDWLSTENISAPQYWHFENNTWLHYTLQGLKEIDPNAPLTHISYYEAFAFAQFKGLRLPTEFEWEVSQHLFNWGQRWEWTESAYLPYPNYKKADGALGEYNGKFMVSQKVLRGGSVATSSKHTRPTYRNFFHPNLRWQYTGLRLAK
ncbi:MULTISPECIES: ergothioneine biosynthesis protein EgtB [Croceibacter]|uniref:ergothioneine biosynthesis protein EgtB n=1 Tax=Croceibacter TaxID=216431 RepID=UPI000C388FA1|nr:MULTISPECIES: ergothioneine biosynthesis protein EgtB [Croceibacter]MBG26971.1 sulfatase maturase [Croceibacter sp.]|tara:strand:- start:17592 stop:18752 length:1161 start_codon:yes stop_codon:yes gene_type:complete